MTVTNGTGPREQERTDRMESGNGGRGAKTEPPRATDFNTIACPHLEWRAAMVPPSLLSSRPSFLGRSGLSPPWHRPFFRIASSRELRRSRAGGLRPSAGRGGQGRAFCNRLPAQRRAGCGSTQPERCECDQLGEIVNNPAGRRNVRTGKTSGFRFSGFMARQVRARGTRAGSFGAAWTTSTGPPRHVRHDFPPLHLQHREKCSPPLRSE